MSGYNVSDAYVFGGLKEQYDADGYYQDNIRPSFMKFIRHASPGQVKLDGQNFNVKTTMQLNESYAAINDGERLPVAQIFKDVFAQYRSKLMYGVIESTSYAGTRGHADGRVGGELMEDLVKGTFMTFDANVDADALGNGRGYRATVLTATPAAASFTVQTSTLLRAGMCLDWYDSTLATKRGTIQIDVKAIDRMARIVYINASYITGQVPAGATAGDVLVVQGALDPGEPADGRYILGYDRICDNTVAVGGLSPSSYALWMATTINAAGANPSQQTLQILWDNLDEISGSYPNRMAFNQGWKRGFLNQFLSQRRFTSNIFDGGASQLTYDPVRMGADAKYSKVPKFELLEAKEVDPTKVLVFNDSAFCFAPDYTSVPALADEDGKDFRFKLGYDAVQGFIRYWGNIVVYKRNAIGQIYNQATPAGVI